MSYRLVRVVRIIHLTLSMHILHECVAGVKNAHWIDKVNWIPAHNYGRPKWHSFTPRHCLTRNKLLNQNCWSWYHLFREKIPHLYQILHLYWGVCCSVFIGPPCIKWKKAMSLWVSCMAKSPEKLTLQKHH